MASAVSVFFIWAINTELSVVCLNAVFNCLINCGFNCLDVVSSEQYPTSLRLVHLHPTTGFICTTAILFFFGFRTTGFGLLSCVGRIAAILGNVTFGNLIDVGKALPVLTTSAVLLSGGLAALKLPESKSLNM